MWLSFLSIIGGPIVSGLIAAYKAHLAAGVATAKTAEELAAAEVSAKTQLKLAQIGHPFEPEKLAMYIVLFYMAKVMLWDAAFHLGDTDAVNGAVGVWAGLVVSFYFGTSTLRKLIK
jgi:hypothetical protein